MANLTHSNIQKNYLTDGFISAVGVISADVARQHRSNLEAIEAKYGNIHYRSKMHTLLSIAADLASSKPVLDIVEQILGPDIMLFDVTYIIKEAKSESHVSWHQDLTYWGFSSDEQVSMWLALSPATEVSGCMRMIPGSHKQGKVEHIDIKDESNVLHRSQNVLGVDETQSVMCPLQPGQASFHHGWTLHASMPNHSDDRRIGFNVQFITPSVKQLINKNESAVLVRGVDEYNYYQTDTLATSNMDEEAIKRHAELEKIRKETWDHA